MFENRPFPKEWLNDSTHATYHADLSMYEAIDIGSSSDGGGHRLCIQSGMTGELGVFYPPNGSKLDPAKVEGLDLNAAQ